MPSFIIHIAIAQEYKKNYSQDINHLEHFLEGTIAPDFGKNREERDKLHYTKNHDDFVSYPDFFAEHQITNDYERGYLLHLIADEAFYCYLFEEEIAKMRKNSDNLYYDYDCINKELLKSYDIPNWNQVKSYIHEIDGTPKYLNLPKVIDFIHTIANISLQEQILSLQKTGKILLK